ncbi:MAG: DUF4430 domain-containing protein, partial [Clostridiales bacterium]|nr:DUF4430 domain-containing protein [Clostridiales bacterium]
GWTDYGTTPSGETFTVRLADGRSIVEVRSGNAVKYHVLYAKEIDVIIRNLSNPEWRRGEPLTAGDSVSIFFAGLKTPVQKLAGIYNPAYPNQAYVAYTTGAGGIITSYEHTQYHIARTNAIALTITEPGIFSLTDGHIYCAHLGDPLGGHRVIPEAGRGANTNAAGYTGPNSYYSTFPDIALLAEGDMSEEKNNAEYGSLFAWYDLTTLVSYHEAVSKQNVTALPPAIQNNQGMYVRGKPEYVNAAMNGAYIGYHFWNNKVFAPENLVLTQVNNTDHTAQFNGATTSDIMYAELIATAPRGTSAYNKTYAFRIIDPMGPQWGLHPYITELKITPNTGIFNSYFDGKFQAVDTNGTSLDLGWGFLATRERHTTSVPYDVDSIKLTATPLVEGDVATAISMALGDNGTTEGAARDFALDVGENAIRVVGAVGSETIEYEVIITRGEAPENFAFALEDGATLTIVKPNGARVQANEDKTYPLPAEAGYTYYYEKPGYATKTGAFDIASDSPSENPAALPSFTDADKLNQASGTARVSIISQNAVLRDAIVRYDAADVPDLARQGYVDYNPGGYTALHALASALEDGYPRMAFSAYKGKLTPSAAISGTPLGGAGWVCEINGNVAADYWKYAVKPGDEIALYYNENNTGQQRAWFRQDEIRAASGQSAALELAGKAAGTDGNGSPIAGARIYIDGTPARGVTTDAGGNAAIPTGGLSAGAHIVTAKLGEPNTLTYNQALLTVEKTGGISNSVAFRLIGAAKHSGKAGYSDEWTEYQNWINPIEYPLAAGESVAVYAVFEDALRKAGLAFTERMPNYISAIGIPEKFGGGALAEGDNGPRSGWMYTVNGVHSGAGLRDKAVKAGDEIIWHYVEDFLTETSMAGGTPLYPNRWLIPPDAAPAPDAKLAGLALADALGYLRSTVQSPGFGTSGGEWTILALARGGYADTAYYDGYYSRVLTEIGGKTQLDPNKSTENSRAILGLTAIGLDAANIAAASGAVNLVAPLADMEWVSKQGINGPIFALLALDAGSYELAGAREALIAAILDAEAGGGGWGLAGTPEPDLTAMALQALAPYRNSDTAADAAINRAIAWLSGRTIADAEGLSQIIVAYSAFSLDPASYVAQLLDGYYDAVTGGFTRNGSVNAMTSDQAAYALVAYDRYMKKLPALYNMSDAVLLVTGTAPGIDKTALEAEIARAEALAQGSYTSATWGNMQAVLAAAKAVAAKADATQKAVDDAKNALAAAISALMASDGGAPGTPGAVTPRRYAAIGVAGPDTPLAASAGGAGGGANVVAQVAVDASPATPDASDRATAKPDAAKVTAAIAEAKKAADEARAGGNANAVAEVVIPVKTEGGTEAKAIEAEFAAETIKAAADAKDVILTIESDVLTLTLDAAALATVAGSAGIGETVVIAARAAAAETLTASQRAAAGGSPVIELAITAGSTAIGDLKGTAAVRAPYAPDATTAAEDYDLLTVYKLEPDGSCAEAKGARYDAASGSAVFTAAATGAYFISEWISPFEDIQKDAWYYRAARYAYSNGLMNGTGNGFEPQATLTRAMLVTIL